MMNERFAELSNKMLEFMNFDPKRKEYKIHFTYDGRNDDIDLDLKLRQILKYDEKFDESGIITLICIHNLCKYKLNSTSIKVVDVLENPVIVENFREIYDIVNSSEIEEVKTKFMTALNQIAVQSTGRKLIGEENLQNVESDFINAIDTVMEGMVKLNFEVYTNSGNPCGKIDRFSPKIQIFGSLSQCLLTLEHAEDGICICYITNSGSFDGYFGIFVKSNGNLFSYNERANEAYIGQHSRLRNGRAIADAKTMDLFPYDELMKCSGHDYKGYATKIEVQEDKLNIFDISRETYMKMVTAMGVVVARHVGKTIDGKQVFVNALLPVNLKSIENREETTALIKIQDSALIRVNAGAVIHFDREKFLAGEYNAEFDHQHMEEFGKHYREVGTFPGYNQILVDIYGQDFQFDDEGLLKDDSVNRLIGDENVHFEFVGSLQRMRLQAYYRLREKLADHIKIKMQKDFESHGGCSALIEWYGKQLKAVKNKIFELCKIRFENENDPRLDGYPHICLQEMETKSQHPRFNSPDLDHVCLTPFERISWCNTKFCCPFYPQYRIKYFFHICPKNYLEVEKLLGVEVPDYCKEWNNGNYCMGSRYTGNPLLDATDKVSQIEIKFSNFQFNAYCGFSKIGMEQIGKK